MKLQSIPSICLRQYQLHEHLFLLHLLPCRSSEISDEPGRTGNIQSGVIMIDGRGPQPIRIRWTFNVREYLLVSSLLVLAGQAPSIHQRSLADLLYLVSEVL